MGAPATMSGTAPRYHGTVQEAHLRYEEALHRALTAWADARHAWRLLSEAMVAADQVDAMHSANEGYEQLWEELQGQASGRNCDTPAPGCPRRS